MTRAGANTAVPGRRTGQDVGLDPELDKMLTAAAAAGRVPASASTPGQARAQLAARAAAGPAGRPVADVCDTAVAGPGGAIPVRVYTPRSAAGTVVYLHGGGWVLGDLDCFDAVCRELASAAHARVVSVDYRLAPEHPYPAALQDAWAAVRWAADRFGLPLALMGESAGGNLAAVCAHRARTRRHPVLALQVLAYPVLDADLTRGSYRVHDRADYLLNKSEMSWFWDQYAPDVAARRDPEAAPLQDADCTGLPATVMLIAEHDPVRDEGFEYADRLQHAGVSVTVLRYPAMAHGFLGLLGSVDEAQRAWEAAGAHVRRAFRSLAAPRSTAGT